MSEDFKKLDFLYEGKAKKLYETNKKNYLWIEFKDDLTAFNAEKKGSFSGKGRLNLKISTHIFYHLEKNGMETHLVKPLTDKDWIVKKTKIIPLEVVVRNFAAGSICKRLGITKGKKFESPVFEVFYKKDELGDPLLTREHVDLLELCNEREYNELKTKAFHINTLLISFFEKIGIDLVDFKIEFGKDEKDTIILSDEISPDSCRLWDSSSGEVLDKDRFRQDLGKVEEKYAEVLKRIEEIVS